MQVRQEDQSSASLTLPPPTHNKHMWDLSQVGGIPNILVKKLHEKVDDPKILACDAGNQTWVVPLINDNFNHCTMTSLLLKVLNLDQC